MATKLKDYYNIDYVHSLANKIKVVYAPFDEALFISNIIGKLDKLTFGERQTLIAQALKSTIHMGYEDTLIMFRKILGPEIEGSLGMFTEGWWLWPIGRYVELYGADFFEESTLFSKELTKRFTGEFCMRPIIEKHPLASMELLLKWSKDVNVRVRRLSSECIRIRLPWSKKLSVALDYFEIYSNILENLKNDTDRSIQKSVANNLNDLYKESPEKFEEIVSLWQEDTITKETIWIIKHASRTKDKNLASIEKTNTH